MLKKHQINNNIQDTILTLKKLTEFEGGKQAKGQFQLPMVSATIKVNLDYKGLQSTQSSRGGTVSLILD